MAMNNEEKKKKKKKKAKQQGLVDVVFSWSITDVLNRDLYRRKVVEIPKTFSSTTHYMNSFVYPLLEETHADLLSRVLDVRTAPTTQIFGVEKKHTSLQEELTFYMRFMKGEKQYEPEGGDLLALTKTKPKCVDDLNTPNQPYVIALVQGMKEGKFEVLLSKPIAFGGKKRVASDNNDKRIFAVYLTNLTTNIRIWQALHSEVEGENMKIIKNVLQIDSSVGEFCVQCSTKGLGLIGIRQDSLSEARRTLSKFKLDSSQEAAVLSCIAARECRHQNTVKLIWGPPGTGKTKTVGSLLFVLLRMKCRTLTCAPTNTAVLGVTTRLMSLVRDSLKYDTYGLGDIVLFGNGERMKIDDHEDLHDIFLSFRVDILGHCLAPLSGWKGSAEWMIKLLEHPEEQYRLYLEKEKEKDDGKKESDNETESDDGTEEEDNVEENDTNKQDLKEAKKKKIWKTLIVKTLKENKNEKKKEKNEGGEEKKDKDKKPFKKKPEEKQLWTFDEFVLKGYNFLGNHLISCIKDLYTHMPTSYIPAGVAAEMVLLADYLKIVGYSLKKMVAAGEGLRKAFDESFDAIKRTRHANKLREYRTASLEKLKYLKETLCFPELHGDYEIRRFCLANACLIFCTASSSIKLHTEGMTPLELVVIDEAAQLKECESTIPLQLPGLHHAILVGDERQLPAMVQSKICEEAEFGRSLFERLVLLGHAKHLLNVQYRMHPSISLFPNKEFYEKKILDGENVKQSTYGKRFLEGRMYGSYSFINVTSAKEEFDNSHSRKNMAEVVVVAEIVASLFKESISRKQGVSVGCISPYKGQVNAIQERLGNKYSNEAESYFSVNVRSVDGFQGGEQDVIILSTVRCNGKGSVGFLSNCQRTNVALTRARYCLWVVGNETTLTNSNSVWKKLVVNAKDRGCFFNASEDKKLSQATMDALLDLGQADIIFSMDSLLFKEAKWKVTFSDMFLETIVRFTNTETRKEVISLLTKLSKGWRAKEDGNSKVDTEGASEILEQYNVSGDIYLIWAVEIASENSKCIQVLKIWDVLPTSKIKELARKLYSLYGNYTVHIMNRCKAKHLEGNLVLPMTWPMNSDTDPSWSLANRLAAISLRNQPTSSFTTSNFRVGNNRKSNNYGCSRSFGRGKRR